ncbi:MAG: hypothetical protein ACRDT1_06090 [Micromonosporaceae bacterium]
MNGPGKRLAGAFLATLALAATGCDALILGDGMSDGICIIEAHDPHESHHNPGRINVLVSIECDKGVHWVSLQARLEKKDGNDWVTVRSKSEKWWDVRANSEQRIQINIPCESGNFRATARASAQREGIPYGPSDWKQGQEVLDPCNR